MNEAIPRHQSVHATFTDTMYRWALGWGLQTLTGSLSVSTYGPIIPSPARLHYGLALLALPRITPPPGPSAGYGASRRVPPAKRPWSVQANHEVNLVVVRPAPRPSPAGDYHVATRRVAINDHVRSGKTADGSNAARPMDLGQTAEMRLTFSADDEK